MMMKSPAREAIASAPPGSSLQDRKREFARNAIWDAAIDLFADKGFDETTVDEIVLAAGTSRRSFFRHFESKAELMSQPMTSFAHLVTKAIESTSGSCTPAELFESVVLAVVQQSAAEPRMAKVMEIAAKYPAARQAQLSRLASVQDQVETAFSQHGNDLFTSRLLATLTISTVMATNLHWLENGQRNIAASARKVLSTLGKIACTLR